MENIEQYIADTLIERPHTFSAGERHFALYPATLGKMFLIQGIVENLGINGDILNKDVSLEALRLVEEKTDDCLTLIYYHTCKTKDEHFDPVRMQDTITYFKEKLSYEDIATLLVVVLSSDRTAEFVRHLGIDKEQKRLAAVMRVKSDKNSFTFGGTSQFGILLDTACERYKWTKDYVVWGIDYSSLRLMLADKVTSIYCTDEEVNKIPSWARQRDTDVIHADKDNMELIKSLDWK